MLTNLKKAVTLILLLSVGIQNFSRTSWADDHNPTSARAKTPTPAPSASPSARLNIVPPDLQAAKDLLKACDKALSDCEAVIKSKEELVKKQEEMINEQLKEIETTKAQRDSIWRSPILWGIIGIAIGGIAVGVIKR